MKFLLFEDNGEFRAGTVLSEAGANIQVELVSGRRAKVKSAQAMLRFDSPAPDALLPAARALAEEIDTNFLWECAPQEEFVFTELADEYFGGRATPEQAGALLLKLHSAPVYFHRKGRGRYRSAPAETLQAALAALERKRAQEAQVAEAAQAMMDGQLPEEVRNQAARLLVRPDKTSLTWKAFERALTATGKSPERLLLELGAFETPRDLHLERFAAEHFPHGFGIVMRHEPLDGFAAVIAGLPLAGVEAFSIDDSTTTEIDDCLSVQGSGAGWRVGIHIAAPGLAIGPGSEMDELARERMSTVYMPGGKITMLPEALIDACSLDEGREVAALSLYLDLDASGTRIVGRHSTAERIRVAANLRHDLLDGVYTRGRLEARPGETGSPDPAPRFLSEMSVLWRFAQALGAERDRVRGKPEPRFRADFSFYLDHAEAGGEPTVRIVARRRDSPLDRIVAEMAILANSEWGSLLGEHQVPGIYRAQQNGRVRVTTHPALHQGLGVAQYMWATSPLRRYVDLVNQRQLLAVLAGDTPPYGHNDVDLFSVISAFDARYSAFAEFQQRMERYWCLRWIAQRGLRRATAVVVREDLARLADAPLYFRLPSMPMLPPGRRFIVELLGTDEIDLSVDARFVEVDTSSGTGDAEDEWGDAQA